MQKIEANVSGGMLTIMKEFIVNSPAQGCFIIVKSHTPSPDRMMAVLNTSVPCSVRCVAVIHKSTESVLMVEDYPVGTEFSVTLPLTEPGNYSVAVFGWSGGRTESSPVDLQQVDITGTLQSNLALLTCIAGIESVCYRYFMFGCRYINTRVAHSQQWITTESCAHSGIMSGWRHIPCPGGGGLSCCSSKHTSKKEARKSSNYMYLHS